MRGKIQFIDDKIILKEILQLSDEAFRLIDLNKKLVLCNRAYAKLNNAKVEEIVGGKCYEFICSRNCNSESCSLEKIKNGETIIRNKVSLKIGSSTKHFNYRVIPVFDAKHTLIGILESFNDVTDIEEARIAIEDEKKKFFYFIDQSKDGIAIADKGGKIIGWNKQIAKMFSIKESEAIEKKLCTTLNKNALRKTLSIDHCFNEKTPSPGVKGISYDFNLDINIDTSVKHIEISIFPFKTSKGAFLGTIARDVTNEFHNARQLKAYQEDLESIIKKRTNDLAKSEERLNLALLATNEGIWEWNLANEKVYFSPTYYTMAGYNDGDFKMSYASWKERVHPDDIANTEKTISKIIKEKEEGYEVRFRFKKKNGEYMWILGKGKVVSWNSNGEPVKLIGTHTDISKLMQTIENLDFTKRKFEYIFNSALDIIAITNTSGEIVEINKKAEELTSLKRENLIGSNMGAHLKIGSDEISALSKQIEEKGDYVYEVIYTNPEKQKIYFEIYSRNINYMNQKAFLHIARDITERKQVQNKLMEIVSLIEDKERKRFAQDLHDGLGAVMSGIKMYLNLLKNTQVDKNKQNEILEKTIKLVSEAADNARRIANNIRPQEFSKFGMVASINNFLHNIHQAGKLDFSINNRLETKTPEEIEIILYRIVTELINNTLNHSGANFIKIDFCNIEQELRICYEDNGKGFDASKINSFNGHGLKNIKGRLNSINGKLEINHYGLKVHSFLVG